MSFLEERIARIVEGRMAGLDDAELSEQLGTSVEVVISYEQNTKDSIVAEFTNGFRDPGKIARRLGISPVILNMFMSHYQIEIPEDIPVVRGKNRRSKEETRAEMTKLVAEGVTVVEEVAERLGLAPSTTGQYAGSWGISLTRPSARVDGEKEPKRSRAKSVAKIKKAIADGAEDVAAISKATGLVVGTVRSYASVNEIRLPRNHGSRTTGNTGGESPKSLLETLSGKKITLLKELLATNPKKLEDVLVPAGLTASSFYRYLRHPEIFLPEGIVPYRTDPKMDILIDQGLKLQKLGDRSGKTREACRQYIIGSGQHQQWRKNRDEVKQKPIRKRNAMGQLIRVLKQRAIKDIKEENWPLAKTWEYQYRNSRSKVLPEELLLLFGRYHQAKKQGVKLSLEELGKGIKGPTHIGRILSKARLPPLYGNQQRTVTSKKKKAMIQRAFGLQMNTRDIAYFIGVNDFVVSHKYQRMGGRKEKGFWLQSRKVTFRLASQVYEAQDIRMRNADICDVLSITPDTLKLIKKKRSEYEPKIVEVLRVIYADVNLSKPYKLTTVDKPSTR